MLQRNPDGQDLASLLSTTKDNADHAGHSLQLKKSNPCTVSKDTLEDLQTLSPCNKSLIAILPATDATEDGPTSHTHTSKELEDLTLMDLTHTLQLMDLADIIHPQLEQESTDGAMSEEETRLLCSDTSNPLDQSLSALTLLPGNTTKEESSLLADNPSITASNSLDTLLTSLEFLHGSSETAGELHGDTLDTCTFNMDKTCAPLLTSQPPFPPSKFLYILLFFTFFTKK